MTDMPDRKRFQHLPIAIILPVILTGVLFFLTIFLLVLPTLETALMSQRRGGIHELTQTALSTLHQYHIKETTGELTRQAAQSQAIAHLRKIRYGPELKDYFWINDMTPRMIMHPYRPDLEGNDISDFKDPNGKRLFVEFVKVVRAKGAGYVDYQWQWKDDPNRIVPKISFVKGFVPWNWVVGTGIYIDDIQAEISAITKTLTIICSGILIFIFLLSAVIIWQGVKVEKERKRVEEELQTLNSRLEQRVRERTQELEQVNRALAKAREEAEAANQAKSNFLANVSHELRTPMNHIMGFIDIVLGSEIGATQKGFLKKARSSSNDLLTIINNIISFSQMDKDELSIEAVDFWLDDVCQDLVASFSEQAGKKGLKLELDGDESVPLGLVGDPQRLTQVLNNLTDNAIKFTQSGHVTIERRLTHQEEGRLTLQFEVRDTGIGISEESMPELFDAFTQGDASSCRAYGGTGVGLAISKKLVALMGGDIWVESTPGEGSSFYFTADFTLSHTAQPKKKATTSIETDISDSLHQEKELVSDAEADQNEKRVLDVETIRPLLVKLSELLEADLMEAMSHLEALEQHFANSDVWEEFSQLKKHIEGFDTDSAMKSLREIASKLEISFRASDS